MPYTRVDTIFDASVEHRMLRKRGVAMPAGDEYLETIVDYALEVDFGKRPIAAPLAELPAPLIKVAA